MGSIVRIEAFVAFIHLIDIYKVTTIFIIIYIKLIVLFYYCSFVYPVAVGVLGGAGGGRRGGAVEHDHGEAAPPVPPAPLAPPAYLVLLYLLHRCVLLPLPLLSPLDHGNQEQYESTQRYRASRHVESRCIRIKRIVQPTCKVKKRLITHITLII